MRQQVSTILRWVAVLPGAVAAFVLVHVVSEFTSRWFLDTDGMLYLIFDMFLSCGVFVYAASRIAPAHRVPTGIVAASVECILLGVVAWVDLTYRNTTSLSRYSPLSIGLMVLGGAVGAMGAAIGLYLDEREKNARTSSWSE